MATKRRRGRGEGYNRASWEFVPLWIPSSDRALCQLRLFDCAANSSLDCRCPGGELQKAFPSGGQTYLSAWCILVGVQGATAPCI